MRKLLFDIESNGLLDTITTIWCLVIKDLETGAVHRFPPERIEEGVRLLDKAELLAGHNIIDYDLPAINKLFPWAFAWLHDATLPRPRLLDTLILAKLIYPDIKPLDFGGFERWGMPKKLIGRQGLEAWGYRLGLNKIDYKEWCAQNGIEDPWAQFTPEMLDYCAGDVELNHRLLLSLGKKQPPRKAVDLEMDYALLAKHMERNGFPLDIAKARKLYAVLSQRKHELVTEVAKLFDDWWAPVGETVAVTRTRNEKVPGEGFWRVRAEGKKTKKADFQLLCAPDTPGWNAQWAQDNRWHLQLEFVPVLREFTEGSTYTNIERVTFNPQSRQHIADRLQKVYGWVPKKFGSNGVPTLDDELLAELPFPPCKLLAEYFLVMKRIGQLAEGNQAWLKLERETEVHGRKAHRVHGQMNTIGTVTFRCSHNKPNMAQVPSVHNAEGVVPYGKECRELFTPESGMVMVGCDASGLQLRALAHNLFPYDSGSYVSVVTTGDVHTANMQAAGLDTRDRAKRFIYCFLFGGGGWKIGFTVGGATPEEIEAVLKKGGKVQQYVLKHLDFVGLPHTPANIATAIKGYGLKSTFLRKTIGLKELIEELQAQAEANKALVGLDGRMVPVRSAHAALNTKLMSDEAVICKVWKTLSWNELHRSGLRNGRDFVVHADVHDEWQVGFRPEIAEEGGKLLQSMVTKAGVELGYLCPLAGEFKIGDSWATTH